jgi:hypothetical protein
MTRVFYHGGKAGLPVGGYILPAKEIGYNEMERAFKIMYGRDYTIEDAVAEGIYDPNYVYLTTDLAYATTRAAVKRGWVYEVEPVGKVESDVDFLAYRCSRARIISRVHVPENDLKSYWDFDRRWRSGKIENPIMEHYLWLLGNEEAPPQPPPGLSRLKREIWKRKARKGTLREAA